MDRKCAAELFPSAAVYTSPAILSAFHRFCASASCDSKTFVDRPLTAPPEEVLTSFAIAASGDEADLKEKCISFFNKYFSSDPDGATAGASERPEDYSESPPLFTQQVGEDGQLLLPEDAIGFATAVKKIWLELYRPQDVDTCRKQSSLIPLRYPFFVAGGRFRECYYWDSYWIIKGLLASDMPRSALSVVKNMLDLVDRIGFMPNANRVYYLNRSQPPFLAVAVSEIFKRGPKLAADVAWLGSVLPTLDREYRSFVDTHVQKDPLAGPNGRLAVYRVDACDTPRPEAWRVDVDAAVQWCRNRGLSGELKEGGHFPNAEDLYQHLAAGAASGWDYSSRWSPFADYEGNLGLESMRATDIIPVCLNSILVATEKTLSELHGIAGNAADVKEAYDQAAIDRQNSMNELLWDDERGTWVDFDTKSSKSSGIVAACGLFPLWARCWPPNWKSSNAGAYVQQLSESRLLQPGGLATTVNQTGQQWDFPNSWPPLVELAVSGLENLESAFPTCGAGPLAARIAGSALRGMFLGMQETAFMHEKYDATARHGRRGGGGEYDPQVGFGWTNGVALDLMRRGYWF